MYVACTFTNHNIKLPGDISISYLRQETIFYGSVQIGSFEKGESYFIIT